MTGREPRGCPPATSPNLMSLDTETACDPSQAPTLRAALPRLSTTKSPGQNSLLSRWCTGKRSLERMLHSTEPSCHITSAEVIVVTTSTATLQGRPVSQAGQTGLPRKGQLTPLAPGGRETRW